MKQFFPGLKMLTPVLFFLVAVACKKGKVITNTGSNSVKISGINYETIKTAGQTWIATNYKGQGGVSYDAANSKPEYGKYYSYSEVKAMVLPEGWRIPTMNDFIKLGESQGIIFTDFLAIKQEASKKIISTTRWLHVSGNNQSGFNAYPAGYIFNGAGPLDGDISEFWTYEGNTFSIQEAADQNSLRLLFYDNSSSDGYKFNLRLVKDN